MANNTQVALVGNLTRDPELRQTAKGTCVVNFSLAVNEGPDKVGFYEVVAWDTLAQNVDASLTKGCRTVVFGRLDFSSWTDKDNNTRNKVQVVAEAVGPDLRFAHAAVVRNEKRVQTAQVGYMNDQEWTAEQAKEAFPGAKEEVVNNWREEPF